ncbi:MAG: NAD(P)-dependent glycerol-3-phosphate dehydrogenase [Desulfovibrio sp.]|nr:NAD(P)-dependent glycerol-3-phosphate dehydrogenase [Desulfovibrio sp.]
MEANLSITVAGGGSWGTALAHHLATLGIETVLWLRDEAAAQVINRHHENRRYLPGLPLHPKLQATTDEACLSSHTVLLAIPCQQLRGWLLKHRTALRADGIFINAAKGIEKGSLAAPSRMVREVLGDDASFAALSGPSFAKEVMQNLPTAVTLASENESLVQSLRDMLSGPTFRCYSSSDVIGVELGGALKNVMAIATGVCDGLGLGHNSRAALITRGLAEISRIGVASGASASTFMGLSGLGDLTLTCTDDLSRNRQVGLRLGKGEPLDDAVRALGMVAEGVATAEAARTLARNLRVEAPICETVCDVLARRRSPEEALQDLMGRHLKDEF